MTSSTTTVQRLLLAALAACGIGTAAAQETYPAKAITWLVPFAAGGPTDAVSRNVAQRVSAALGQSIVVENLGGAGGTIGAAKVARARADGYSLFVGHIGTMAAAPSLFKSLRYDPNQDFVPVFRFPDTPMALLVGANSPYRTATDLFEAARKDPGKLTFGTAGVGSSSHLAAEHLASVVKVQYTFVPYKGTGPAMADLMGGQIDAMLDQTNVSLPQTQGGRLRALALTSQARMALFPGVPTLAEKEVPGFLASTWYGLYAPADTPAHVIDVLQKAYAEALADKEYVQSLEKQGIEVLLAESVSADALGRFMRSEQEKWQRVVREAGIDPQ
ncbi:Tricarboxylate transport protein TctC [plant metagenome]|uniref:Tricarboxylate transport protein TctC n=1 Tax=plant metagenome TaxID=1297885 RepID=A0A484UC56_9ZZZZ